MWEPPNAHVLEMQNPYQVALQILYLAISGAACFMSSKHQMVGCGAGQLGEATPEGGLTMGLGGRAGDELESPAPGSCPTQRGQGWSRQGSGSECESESLLCPQLQGGRYSLAP